ncbi:uncharacterized protein LOC121543212 [Coregonus clupeaformis]|uniref:uncharacterized protein LOC121543212 n=1 Tax=Coregonus clupeaformis TaxID=59861 RepID=UPI001BE08B9E|nr:uncharacterized protein LOC121543212 [Coregonus clupeaformis]
MIPSGVMVSTLYAHVVFQMVSCANAHTIGCNVTQYPNGTTTYHLSEPPPSISCETEWAYPNGSTLTFKGETNSDQVLGVTRQSITTTVCLGTLKYTVDCVKPQVVNKVECNCTMEHSRPSPNPDHIKAVRPEHNICFGDWCVSGITFGLSFGISAAVIIILVLLIRYKIHIYRVCVSVGRWVNGSTREPSPDPAPALNVKYSTVNQQATVIV